VQCRYLDVNNTATMYAVTLTSDPINSSPLISTEALSTATALL